MEDELAILLNGRGWIYHFLEKCLYEEPSWDNLEPFISVNALAAVREDVKEAGLLADVLEEMKGWTGSQWEALSKEAGRLFFNSGPVIAPPWESVYLSEEHIIYDEHTLAVQEFYRRWGVVAQDRARGPADHIGLECSFMAFLNGEAMRAAKDGADYKPYLKAQAEFLEGHLLQFADSFSELVAKNSESPFYQAVGAFLPYFLKSDLELVKGLIESAFESSAVLRRDRFQSS